MVLCNSDSPRYGYIEGVEEAEHGVFDRICIPYPCRDGSDSETVCRRTHKSRTPLVVETMEDPEESDSHKCDYVCTGWSLNWSPVEMERAVGCRWIEYRYRTPAASNEQRSV